MHEEEGHRDPRIGHRTRFVNGGTVVERFVGIDVGKTWLDVVEQPAGAHAQVANDPAGWAQLLARIGPVGLADPPLIALEASGGYEAGVVLALDAAGLTPAVANPVATRRFAQSLGRRAKTDRIDAAMLAQYAARMRPTPRPVPGATARRLRALLARREAVVKMLVEEQNRAQEASALVRPQIEAVVALLTAQKRELDHLLASAVAADPDWQARVDLLDSVPGIGPLTATILAVGLPDLGQGSAKAQAALLGVAPHPHESGRYRGRRRIGGGRAWVRHVVYEATLTTVRCEPTFRAHYRQLRARGKTHKQAMVACVRRLVGILHAMLRDGLTWPQTAVGQGQFLAPPT
jgi:transposase